MIERMMKKVSLGAYHGSMITGEDVMKAIEQVGYPESRRLHK